MCQGPEKDLYFNDTSDLIVGSRVGSRSDGGGDRRTPQRTSAPPGHTSPPACLLSVVTGAFMVRLERAGPRVWVDRHGDGRDGQNARHDGQNDRHEKFKPSG